MARQAEALEQTDPDPGRAWMLALQAGDESAFPKIVHAYGRKVIGFFRRWGADPSRAEDLAQEAFLRVFRAKDHYEPSARFATWMYRITQRIAQNESTRSRWRDAVQIRTSEEDDETGVAPLADRTHASPLQRLHSRELQERLRNALQELPERQRMALLLNRFEGLSYEEVGDVLGLKIPAVKSLLFRARDNLKHALSGEVSDGLE